MSGDQAFVFRGSQGFSGGGVGSVRVVQFTGYTVVEVDNGNGGTAEMQIQLNKVSLTSGDFLL